jgi:hypothetical protein
MRRHQLVCCLAGLTTACGAGWHRPARLDVGPLAPRQQVQVWRGDQAERWHAVTVTRDSISGVPYLKAPGCDGCRVALHRGAVDSLRLGNPTAGFWKTLGLVVGLPALAVVLACSGGEAEQPCWD